MELGHNSIDGCKVHYGPPTLVPFKLLIVMSLYMNLDDRRRGVQYPLQRTGQLPFQLSIKRGVSATDQQEGHEARRSDIEQALGRVLAGSSFRSSPQCQALLRYIVEHSLSHENELLRERVIGIKGIRTPVRLRFR